MAKWFDKINSSHLQHLRQFLARAKNLVYSNSISRRGIPYKESDLEETGIW